MASLALVVTIIYLFVVLIGPLTFLLSKIKIVPPLIIQLMGLLSIVLGIWWLTILPGNITGLLAILTIYLGWRGIKNKDAVLDNR